MAGSIVFTYSDQKQNIKKVEFDWLSDASTGAVSGVLTKVLSGIIDRVTFVPDGGGTAPTALYDVVLNDTEGFDVLNGKGANLSATVTTSVSPAFTGGNLSVEGVLDLVVSNAGNAKGGKVFIYVR